MPKRQGHSGVRPANLAVRLRVCPPSLGAFRMGATESAQNNKFLPRPICRNALEGVCCINFGGFSLGFSWRIFLGTFSHKNERKKKTSGEKIREKKSGGSKIKIREKSVLPKAGPKNVSPFKCNTISHIFFVQGGATHEVHIVN